MMKILSETCDLPLAQALVDNAWKGVESDVSSTPVTPVTVYDDVPTRFEFVYVQR